MLDGDGQFADPVARGVVDGVGDGGTGADLPDLADALDPERPGDVIFDLDEVDVDVGRVSVDRDEILAEAGAGPAGAGGVHPVAFEQRLAHSPQHAAHELAAGGPGVEDPAGSERAGHVPDPDDAELGVDGDLRELGAEGQQPVRGVQRRRVPAADGLGVGHPVPAHQGGVGLAGAGIAGKHQPPAGRGDRSGVGAVKRGLRVGDGHRDQLVADRGAGVVHGGTDHHRAVGADRRAGARQAGVAELDPDVAQLDAERVGGDLGQHGGGAGAKFLGGGLHDGGAVGVQVSAGPLGPHEERDRVGGGRHAGADEPVPVPGGPRPRVPAGPADPLRAALQAFGQPVAGPRVAAAGLGPGQVAQPQLDRVDAEVGGEFVHRAFEGEHAERLAGPAGERGGHGVAPDQPVNPLVGGAGIQPGGNAEGGLGPVVER